MQNDEIEKNKSLKNWEKKLNPLELTWPTRYSWHEIKIKKKKYFQKKHLAKKTKVK